MDEILCRILQILKSQGRQQKALADALGITDKSVSSWVSGRSKSYTKYLYQIAAYLNTTPEYLRGETDDPTPRTTYNNNVGGSVHGAFIGGSVSAGEGIYIEGGHVPNDDERALIEMYRMLGAINRAKLLLYAEELLKTDDKAKK